MELSPSVPFQCCWSLAKSCPILCDPMYCSTPGFPVFHHFRSILKFMSIKLVMLSNHLILCHPLPLPSVFPSIRVFSNESSLSIRWPKYWSFSFSISPFNDYSGLISFRIDWFDLLAAQGNLKVFSSTIIQRPFQYCKILHSTLLGPLIMLILSFQINFINYS